MQVSSPIAMSRDVAAQRGRTSFVALGLAVALSATACTAGAGSGDASPSQSQPTTQSVAPSPSGPASGVVAGLAWPDGSPVVATTVDPAAAAEVTGTTEIGRFPIYGHPTIVPQSVNADGTVVVSQFVGGSGDRTWGGNDAIGVWDGTVGPWRSSVEVSGDGSRGVSDAVTDGTTLVWLESVGDTGTVGWWAIYAAPADGPGTVRQLASSDDLDFDDLSWDLGAGSLVVDDGRAYYGAPVSGPDGTAPYALYSVSLKGGDLRLEVPRATDQTLGADGIIVARTEAEEKGTPPNSLSTATSLDLVAPGKDPRTLITFERGPGASTFTQMQAAGSHVVVSNEQSLVVLDPAGRSALRVVAPAAGSLGSVGACDDRVIWTFRGPDIDGEPQFDVAEWFILTPSTGEVVRRTAPSTGGPVMCAGDVVMLAESDEEADPGSMAVVLRVPSTDATSSS